MISKIIQMTQIVCNEVCFQRENFNIKERDIKNNQITNVEYI